MATDDTVQQMLEKQIKENTVMIYSKSRCPYCKRIKALFDSLNIAYTAFETNTKENMPQIHAALHRICGQRTVPNVFINGTHIGGHDETLKMNEEGKLLELIGRKYEYDLIVIGGGSGGLSAAKEAAKLGRKVAVLDFVKPTPKGASWGLGGTCVNVGCIPKKLMHQAGLLGKNTKEATKFGWSVDVDSVKLSWERAVASIQDYIGSLNWTYRVQLRDNKINFVNSWAEFVDQHTIKAINRRGKATNMSAEKFVIAVGERPRYPDIPGALEYGITSDDLFSLSYCPGKTLIVGASYVALECGGFLNAIGFDVTIMVRSIFLRGFDQQMANKIGEHLEKNERITILKRCVPLKIEEISEGEPGLLQVTSENLESNEEFSEKYNTVVFAIGRISSTKALGLEHIGITPNKNGKIFVDEYEHTAVPNIYCIGDNALNRPELTPTAIAGGYLLARRLYSDSKEKCDYTNVATTVFTPLEYSCCGMSEEAAIERYGENNLEVYHTNFLPLEWALPGYDTNLCYAKVIVDIRNNGKILGMHYLGPNAGEVMQGFAVAMKCGLTKHTLDATIGIHPTAAEVFTTLTVTKSSGINIAQPGGC